jgi:hypothetical protein
MDRRRSEDRLYTAILLAFLVGLVALGLLGVPALLVATIGMAAAVLGITVFDHLFDGGRAGGSRRRDAGRRVPPRYVPSVLEASRTRRRGILHLRRHRHASPPLRLR